jgi:hypothetical protein
MTAIGELVRAVFDAWNREAIAFVVLRNYERLPEDVGNDLDVLVVERDRAQRIILDQARFSCEAHDGHLTTFPIIHTTEAGSS